MIKVEHCFCSETEQARHNGQNNNATATSKLTKANVDDSIFVEISIEITRPTAIPGKIITIDNARLTYSPGKRSSTSGLNLNIRSS